MYIPKRTGACLLYAVNSVTAVDTRRVYDQCESVASFRSDEAELCRLQHRFERIKLNTWILGYMIYMGVWKLLKLIEIGYTPKNDPKNAILNDI